MSIETVYRVQCKPCERYLAPEERPWTVQCSSTDSPLFLNFSSAYDEAVKRGWSNYPLLCPDCAADLKDKVRDEPQDGGTVRQPGEGP